MSRLARGGTTERVVRDQLFWRKREQTRKYGVALPWYVFSFRMVFFYLVTTGWIFTSAYVKMKSINNRTKIERHYVSREEYREEAPDSA